MKGTVLTRQGVEDILRDLGDETGPLADFMLSAVRQVGTNKQDEPVYVVSICRVDLRDSYVYRSYIPAGAVLREIERR